MLLSLTRKFLFIANLKTASTAIERVLAPQCELRLVQSNFGKHQTFAEFAERFRWLLSLTKVEELFIFGVIRDPVDFVVSIFNSHRQERFKDNARLYTGNLDFGQFIEEWVPRNADQLRNQHVRFVSSEGRLVTNFLISYEELEAGLRIVAERLNAPDLLKLPRVNSSPAGLSRADLTPEQIAWIEARFRRDREFIDKHANKLV